MGDSTLLPGKLKPKLYYSIGEVADAYDVEPHTLRYWEEEFPDLRPGTTPGGQRRYRKEDIEVIGRIHHLVREEKYTVEGAREKLETWEEQPDGGKVAQTIEQLCEDGLSEIRAYLDTVSNGS